MYLFALIPALLPALGLEEAMLAPVNRGADQLAILAWGWKALGHHSGQLGRQ